MHRCWMYRAYSNANAKSGMEASALFAARKDLVNIRLMQVTSLVGLTYRGETRDSVLAYCEAINGHQAQ